MGTIRTEKAVLAVSNLPAQDVTNQRQKMSAENFVQSAADALNGTRDTGTGDRWREDSKNQFQLLEVQYNPSSLKMSASGQNTSMENMQAAGSAGVVRQETKPAVVTLSFDLVVDGQYTLERVSSVLKMLESELSRRLIFCWGDIIFPGELTSVDTQYTMFSLQGEPMAGKISMTVCQESQVEAAYWEKAFQKCFQS